MRLRGRHKEFCLDETECQRTNRRVNADLCQCRVAGVAVFITCYASALFAGLVPNMVVFIVSFRWLLSSPGYT
jgi:hypothetical protein